MKTKRVIVGMLVAGVTLFFLGWFVYGMLLLDFMAANCNNPNARPESEMVWWSLIVSNLAWGLLLSLILVWDGRLMAGPGAKIGAIFGLLIGVGFDLSMYSMTTMYSNLIVIAVDSLAAGLMYAIAGAITAWAMGRIGTKVIVQ
jgi:hypothetical protein